MKNMASSDNWFVDLRIYQNRLYMNTLAVGVFRALSGRDTPQKALDEVARRWEIITKSVGRDKQRQAYSHVVEMENRQFHMENTK